MIDVFWNVLGLFIPCMKLCSSLSNAQGCLESSPYFTSGFIPHQQWRPQNRLSSLSDPILRSATPWIYDFWYSLSILVVSSLGELSWPWPRCELAWPCYELLIFFAHCLLAWSSLPLGALFLLFLNLSLLASGFIQEWLILDIKSTK